MEETSYPRMLYKGGAWSGEQKDQLIVNNQEEEEAAFAHDFCQLVPVDKSKPKDAKAEAEAVVAKKTGKK